MLKQALVFALREDYFPVQCNGYCLSFLSIHFFPWRIWKNFEQFEKKNPYLLSSLHCKKILWLCQIYKYIHTPSQVAPLTQIVLTDVSLNSDGFNCSPMSLQPNTTLSNKKEMNSIALFSCHSILHNFDTHVHKRLNLVIIHWHMW